MHWVYISLALLVWFLPVPIMAVIALLRWPQSSRESLPRWRNTMGPISIIAILCGWLLIVILTLIEITHESWMSIFTARFYLALLLFVIIATLAAFTLKGRSRFFAIAAGLINTLMSALWLLRSGMP